MTVVASFGTVLNLDSMAVRELRRPGHTAVQSGRVKAAFELGRQLLVRAANPAPNPVGQIIAGKCPVTGDTALRFGDWFGSDPQFCLDLHARHDVAQADRRTDAEFHHFRRGLPFPERAPLRGWHHHRSSDAASRRPTDIADGTIPAPKLPGGYPIGPQTLNDEAWPPFSGKPLRRGFPSPVQCRPARLPRFHPSRHKTGEVSSSSRGARRAGRKFVPRATNRVRVKAVLEKQTNRRRLPPISWFNRNGETG